MCRSAHLATCVSPDEGDFEGGVDGPREERPCEAGVEARVGQRVGAGAECGDGGVRVRGRGRKRLEAGAVREGGVSGLVEDGGGAHEAGEVDARGGEERVGGEEGGERGDAADGGGDDGTRHVAEDGGPQRCGPSGDERCEGEGARGRATGGQMSVPATSQAPPRPSRPSSPTISTPTRSSLG